MIIKKSHDSHPYYSYFFLMVLISILTALMITDKLLFHFISGLATQVYGLMIFALYWNRMNSEDSVMLRFIGIGFLFVAVTDLVHVISYMNMGILKHNAPDIHLKLWLAARIMQAVTIFLAVTLKKALKPFPLLGIYTAATVIIFLTVFKFELIPPIYGDVKAHTYRIIAEYFIIALLSLSLFFHVRRNRIENREISLYLTLAIVFSILTELCFASFLCGEGPLKNVGLIMKVLTFFMLFRTILMSALSKPQENLFKELTQFYQVVESSPLAITITNPDGIIEYVNPKFIEATGYSAEEAVGRNMRILKSGIQDKQFYKKFWDTILSGKEWKGIFCNKRKDGKFFWEKASISSIKDSTGQIVQFIGLKEDITRERINQEKERTRLKKQIEYRSLLLTLSQIPFTSIKNGLEKMTESIVESLNVKRASVWKFINGRKQLLCLELYTEGRHFDGKKLDVDLFPFYYKTINTGNIIVAEDAHENEVFSELIKHGLIPKENTSIVDVPLFIMGDIFGVLSIQHTGEIRRWSAEEQNFITGMGSIISTLIETFERIETGKKLVVAVEDAKRANSIKSEFLANMSHEIRTPMNAILGFTEILLNRIKEGEEREFLESINSSGKHLLSLINDILDLSKIEAERIEFSYKPYRIYSIIEGISNLFTLKAKEKGIDLLFEISSGIPETIIIDGDRLSQILINVVGNAVKFTEKGFVKVSFSHEKYDRSKDTVRIIIEVEDTGIGIPEEEKENIFNPFAQTDTGSKAKYGGTGLGLAISRKLAKLMNGDITIADKQGSGTLFRIILDNVKIAEDSREKERDNNGESEQYGKIPSNKTETDDNGGSVTLNEVLEILKRDFMKTYRLLSEKLSIQAAKRFAEELSKTGIKYDIPILTEWSENLKEAVMSFNKHTILEILAEFPDLVDRIELLKKEQEN